MKVFVYCPYDLVTGGPEALHQFAEKGKLLGYDVRIVYWPRQQSKKSKRSYGCYDVNVAVEASDDIESYIVVPESQTYILRNYKNANKVVWWLSVDNYYKSLNAFSLRRNLKKQSMYSPEEMEGCIHAAQSAYACNHLSQLGYKNVSLLTDYIRHDFCESAKEQDGSCKLDTVLYNPAKGIEFTRRLIRIDSSVNWVPIEGKSPGEVIEMLKSAKAYIDFGHHPGRDRMPREAVLCGCCIITGVKGSAGNNIDMPIPDKYKYDQDLSGNDRRIVSHVHEIIEMYPSCCNDFNSYRAIILDQEAVFTAEVNSLLESFAGYR